MNYSRAQPSPRYQALLAQYRVLHRDGDALHGRPPEATFNGVSLQQHVPVIAGLIRRHGARSLLDYGCGKAQAYDSARLRRPDGFELQGLRAIWGLETVRLYDPGHAPFAELPSGRFDAVISTDMLEHCAEEDLDWILAELFGFAGRFLFCSIACFPALKTLPSGENAHVTVKSGGWWIDRIAALSRAWPEVRYYLFVALSADQRLLVEG